MRLFSAVRRMAASLLALLLVAWGCPLDARALAELAAEVRAGRTGSGTPMVGRGLVQTRMNVVRLRTLDWAGFRGEVQLYGKGQSSGASSSSSAQASGAEARMALAERASEVLESEVIAEEGMPQEIESVGTASNEDGEIEAPIKKGEVVAFAKSFAGELARARQGKGSGMDAVLRARWDVAAEKAEVLELPVVDDRISDFKSGLKVFAASQKSRDRRDVPGPPASGFGKKA